MGKKKLPNLQQYGNYQFADEFEKMMQKAGITKGNLVNSKEITSESDDSKDNLTLYKQNTGVPQNFRELAAILNSPKVVVSLDCEFCQDDAGEMWLRQLAIKQFGTSNILAYQFFGGKATLSLAKMGKLLGIDGFVPRHVAKNDVLLLDAILQFYAHDFNAEII